MIRMGALAYIFNRIAFTKLFLCIWNLVFQGTAFMVVSIEDDPQTAFILVQNYFSPDGFGRRKQ